MARKSKKNFLKGIDLGESVKNGLSRAVGGVATSAVNNVAVKILAERIFPGKADLAVQVANGISFMGGVLAESYGYANKNGIIEKMGQGMQTTSGVNLTVGFIPAGIKQRLGISGPYGQVVFDPSAELAGIAAAGNMALNYFDEGQMADEMTISDSVERNTQMY